MQTKKMNLANIQGKLSRAEMKNIMAGSGGHCDTHTCNSPDQCGGNPCYNCGSQQNGFWGTCDKGEAKEVLN
jgi:hypothetical protein